MFFSPRMTLFLLLLLLTGLASGQELYVSNRPFKGEVVKAGSGLQVELEPLLKALKLNLNVEGGQLRVGDKVVPVVQSVSGKTMVSLAEFSAAANLTVRKNADFGHIDVYATTSAPGGAWGDETAAASSGRPGASAGGADYLIKVPPDYEMINDPDMMDALMGMVAKKSPNPMLGAMNFEFVMSPKAGTRRTGIVMLMTMNLPGTVPAEEEPSFVRAVTEGMQQKGKLLSGPTAVNIGGQRFHRSVIKTDTQVMECNIHLAAALGKVYWLALVDEESGYATSFPALRNVVDTFRLK